MLLKSSQFNWGTVYGGEQVQGREIASVLLFCCFDSILSLSRRREFFQWLETNHALLVNHLASRSDFFLSLKCF